MPRAAPGRQQTICLGTTGKHTKGIMRSSASSKRRDTKIDGSMRVMRCGTRHNSLCTPGRWSAEPDTHRALKSVGGEPGISPVITKGPGLLQALCYSWRGRRDSNSRPSRRSRTGRVHWWETTTGVPRPPSLHPPINHAARCVSHAHAQAYYMLRDRTLCTSSETSPGGQGTDTAAC